jgi:hypothetical protein
MRRRLNIGIYEVTHTLIKRTAGSDALGFREEYLLLQLKCGLLVGGQDRAYLFQNPQNREDPVQR